MRKTIFLSVALVAVSFFATDFLTAEDVPRGGGGFLVGRIAAKKIKKIREQENFSGADQNRDGKLDKKEIESAKKTHGDFIDNETFKKIDTNGDGMLSHDECERFQKEADKSAPGAKGPVKSETDIDRDVKTDK